MNCPQCHANIRAQDKYCSQCGCDLQTGKAIAPDIKNIDQALEKLEQRLVSGKPSFLPEARQGGTFFAMGMVLSGLYLFNFLLLMLPFSPTIYWAQIVVLMLQLMLPMWMAWKTPNKAAKALLFVVAVATFALGFWQSFIIS